MSKKRVWLGIFITWLLVDVACLAGGKWRIGLFDFGVRGLVIDFVLGAVVLGMYIRSSENS